MILKRKIAAGGIIAIVGLGIAAGVYAIKDNIIDMASAKVDARELPISSMQGSYVIDVNDPKETVGYYDYVFVGKVVDSRKTVYKDAVTMEDKRGGKKEVGRPFTLYGIEVVENIKGNLVKNTPIEVWKDGGIASDKKSVSVYENDELPVENKYYIFVCFADTDGSLYITGPNSNIPLEVSDEKEIVSSQRYKEYQEAFENEIITIQRGRNVSKYEAE